MKRGTSHSYRRGTKASSQRASLYVPALELAEIRAEASRLHRSISWVFRESWRRAREELQKLPSPEESSAPEP